MLYKSYCLYDIVATSTNIVLLEKIKNYYDLRNDIIFLSIFGKPVFVIDSCDNYGIVDYFNALKQFKRYTKEIKGFL